MGFILAKASAMRISIPLDMSSRPFVVLFNGLFLRKSRSHLGVKRVVAGIRDKRRH